VTEFAVPLSALRSPWPAPYTGVERLAAGDGVSAAPSSSGPIEIRTSGEERAPAGLYEHILEADSHLVLLQSPFIDEVLVYLRMMAQRRGHSIYSWNPDAGLSSLREHGITVAATRRLPDALRYLLQSSHFGVYVFPAGRRELTPQVLAVLRQIGRGKEGGDKRVLMLASKLEVPAGLESLATLIVHKHGPSNRLRLRDGRWIRG
jgi:hypothetical protein